jgi:hypothetical protein
MRPCAGGANLKRDGGHVTKKVKVKDGSEKGGEADINRSNWTEKKKEKKRGAATGALEEHVGQE